MCVTWLNTVNLEFHRSNFLTQERGDVIIHFISVCCFVKLQVDIRAGVVLSAEHLQTLG